MENGFEIIAPFACRHCLAESHKDFTLLVDKKIYDSLEHDTEFEGTKRLLAWGAFDRLKCSVCNSLNLMMFGYKKDGDFVYKKNNLKSCTGDKKGVYISISKKGNQVIPKIQFSENLSPKSHKGAWIFERLIMHFLSELKFFSLSTFDSSFFGKTEIMLFGNEDSVGIETQINRFFSIGITKEEILSALRVLLRKNDIFLSEISNLHSTRFDIRRDPEKFFESVHFRGALLKELYENEFETGSFQLRKGDSLIGFKVDDKFFGLKVPENTAPLSYYHTRKGDTFFVPTDTKPFFTGLFVYLLEEFDDMPI